MGVLLATLRLLDTRIASEEARECECQSCFGSKERKKRKNPKEGWEDGTPPHRVFTGRKVCC